jgi:hypothetical protein
LIKLPDALERSRREKESNERRLHSSSVLIQHSLAAACRRATPEEEDEAGDGDGFGRCDGDGFGRYDGDGFERYDGDGFERYDGDGFDRYDDDDDVVVVDPMLLIEVSLLLAVVLVDVDAEELDTASTILGHLSGFLTYRARYLDIFRGAPRRMYSSSSLSSSSSPSSSS